MTAPPLATDTNNGRTYRDTLGDCDLLHANGWSGPFEAPSVTTINNVADKGGGLDLWKRRTVAEYTIDHTHIWPNLEDHPYHPERWQVTVDKWANDAGWRGRGPKSVYRRAIDEYNEDTADDWHRKLAVDLCAEAPNRHARDKAQQGTDLHKVFEDVAHGRVPVALLPDDQTYIDQVRDFFDRWQPEIICCERPVFSRTHGYAGTPDTFLKLPTVGTILGDLKRRNGSYDDIAYQLAPYANADYMIIGDAGQQRVPIPPVTGAVEIHFPPEGGPAQVIPVDLDGAMDVFLGRVVAWRDRNRRRLQDPLDPPAVIPGDPGRRANLEARISIYRAFFQDTGIMFWLSRHWPDYPTLKKWGGHTAGQLAEIERLLDRAEAEHGLPLPLDTTTAPTNSNNNEGTAA